MAYVPPTGNAVTFNFTSGYTAPVGSVTLNFSNAAPLTYMKKRRNFMSFT